MLKCGYPEPTTADSNVDHDPAMQTRAEKQQERKRLKREQVIN
jgi:hypothetical protein